MLKQRVVTALVLLALLLAALFAPSPWPFDLLTLALIGAAGWEWSRLNESGELPSIAFGVGLVLACLAALAVDWTESAPRQVWWLAALVWVPGGAWALRLGPDFWPALPRFARRLLGGLALWTAWLALVNAKATGLNFLLSVLCLVWAADIAAYFGGRAFGRRKLAPSISPGKTWEGALGGVAGALVWAIICRRVFEDVAWPAYLVAAGILAAASIVGDLFESAAKRRAGVKDSGRLLPGHGGILDRIDSATAVLPIAALLLGLQKGMA